MYLYFSIIVIRFRAAREINGYQYGYLENFEDSVFFYCRPNPEELKLVIEAFDKWTVDMGFQNPHVLSIETKDDAYTALLEERKSGPFYEIGVTQHYTYDKSFPDDRIIVQEDDLERVLESLKKSDNHIFDVVKLPYGYFVPVYHSNFVDHNRGELF